MRTSRIFFYFFHAPVLGLVWLIKHRVDSALLTAPQRIEASLGGSVTVSCWYDPRFRENTKYWCRGPVYGWCEIVVKTPRNRENDRVFIADDKEAGVFNVTMSLLKETDADMYWCVIATSGRNVHTGVRLQVSLSGCPSEPNSTVAAPTTTSPILTKPEKSLWATLRWIIFFAMLCCLVLTRIAVWRIKAARNI